MTARQLLPETRLHSDTLSGQVSQGAGDGAAARLQKTRQRDVGAYVIVRPSGREGATIVRHLHSDRRVRVNTGREIEVHQDTFAEGKSLHHPERPRK